MKAMLRKHDASSNDSKGNLSQELEEHHMKKTKHKGMVNRLRNLEGGRRPYHQGATIC